MSYTERTQVLLSPEQRARIERLAADRGSSVGAVVRDAIDAYVDEPSAADRQRALADLFAIDAPVADWSDLEREIAAGYEDSRS